MNDELPSPGDGEPNAVERREEALVAAAAARGRLDVLKRHAEGDRLIALSTKPGAGRLIEVLMPTPAGEGAQITPGRAAAHFVARRAEEERAYAAEAVARLPAMWLAVIGANPGEIRDALAGLGADTAASVSRPMNAAAAAAFLSPLGDELARRAADQRARRDVPRPPAAMLAVWEGVYRGSALRGAALAHDCGKRILGDLLRRLPRADQELAARVARTMIVRELMMATPIEREAGDDGRLAAGIVAWMMADARRAGEHRA